MELSTLDYGFVIGFFLLALMIGFYSARQAGKNSASFFLSGRHMPWWLLGMSMVATTFSTDTPNLVTDIVRKNGVAGNWVWWAFLLTGMLTVFLYAKLWRRSGVLTDIEFYELRYSGRSAAFLRGFRAIYLGVFFNIMIMASVSLAAIKIGGVMLGLAPWECIVYASAVTVCFSTMGGLTGVLLTDFFLFFIALIGAFAAAFFAIGHVDIGSLSTLFSHPNVAGKLDLVPHLEYAGDGSVTPESLNLLISVLIMPIAVQWWSVWYPGAEPGGGGYLAQRMLAAKNESHATAAVLFFNAAHYALRPWPWIIVALCSLIVFPDLESIRQAFPDVNPEIIDDDLAYPAMLKAILPSGWLGLVLASLAAAYMSTISTHLNWGSSYVVNDVYKRFIKPDATDRQQVLIGRVSTIAMMVAAGFLALQLSNALQAFSILLQIGAGTGLLFILRWFWWRINAVSELVAMVVSFVVAVGFQLGDFGFESWQELLIGVSLTTVAWVSATLISTPTDSAVLKDFCVKINPGGPGWRHVYAELAAENRIAQDTAIHIPSAILCMVLGCAAVYGALFATGLWMYGETTNASILTVVTALSIVGLMVIWQRNGRLQES
ncbi:Sodium/glucose cotransporter [Rubripirellula obstinata]|uniref:Sodium/glucose cotransporter n=1 Tax=Rubripirellula obstinata TaxID=406547 RepID=A0A5B1C9A1_9BACT|nr:sodium:solute symporter family protein [Rubripirellula obstinata]KAA1257728.1 Sodium/glucose cotransporter [Rubripirellula obstinata]